MARLRATHPYGPASSATRKAGGATGMCDGKFSKKRDLVGLHYDHAPDHDDGHAAVAGREVTDHLGVSTYVVGGATGKNRDRYQRGSESVMNAAWGSTWYNAHSDWSGSVSKAVKRWEKTMKAGGDVWIAEGGQSDFTADVIRGVAKVTPNAQVKRCVHVVQHSDWNENNTHGNDLVYVKAHADYWKIADGNKGGNGTADLNNRSGGFEKMARSGRHANAWKAAFGYLSPKERIDFSDTVELLAIAGVGTGQVNNVDDFARKFIANRGVAGASS